MIHHWEGLVLEITAFEYHHDPTPSAEIIPSQTLNLKHVQIIKFKLMVSLIHHWKDLDLQITDFGYHHDLTPSSGIIPSISYIFDIV